MSLFKIPILENRLVFLLPVIFFMFFIISLISYLRKDEPILKTLIYFIFFLTLLKFTRSKEFGTDIPVIALIFLIQIYLLRFNSTKKLDSYYKKEINTTYPGRWILDIAQELEIPVNLASDAHHPDNITKGFEV